MKSVIVVGAGKIGTPVINWLDRSEEWEVTAVLTRSGTAHPASSTNLQVLTERSADVVLDLSGPEFLKKNGLLALAHSDVWTINGTALVADDIRAALAERARTSGHTLRVLVGALPGASTVAAHAQARGTLQIVLEHPRIEQSFDGTLADAAEVFPNSVNFAAALALAGPGVENTRMTVQPSQDMVLTLKSESQMGTLTVTRSLDLPNPSGLHPIAATVIAHLSAETALIRFV